MKFKILFLDSQGQPQMEDIIDITQIISVIRECKHIGLHYKLYILFAIRIF